MTPESALLLPCPHCDDAGEKNIFTATAWNSDGTEPIERKMVQCLTCHAESEFSVWNKRNHERIVSFRNLIADDTYFQSFTKIGDYRKALISVLDQDWNIDE